MEKRSMSNAELDELNAQQISEMAGRLRSRRADITMRLNDAFRHGKTSEAEVLVAENTREARAVAHTLLSGGSTNLLPENPKRSREAELMIERDGIDIALRSLQQDELRIRASAAACWAEDNRERWMLLWRRALIARAQAQSAEDALVKMRIEAGRLGAELPLAPHVTKGFIVADDTLIEMDRVVSSAIDLGYVSGQDLLLAAEATNEPRR